MLVKITLDPTVLDVGLFVFDCMVLPLVFFCKDGFRGYSPGKALARVQVVDRTSYEPIGFVRSLKRNLPLLIPLMPLVIAFWLQRGLRLGDGWAQSKVIWKKYANHPVFTGRLACERCQYDLIWNSSGVCPECGAPISVTNQAVLSPSSVEAGEWRATAG